MLAFPMLNAPQACGIHQQEPARGLGREPELRFLDRRMLVAQLGRFSMNKLTNEENRSDR
jgi:hypothetical protein